MCLCVCVRVCVCVFRCVLMCERDGKGSRERKKKKTKKKQGRDGGTLGEGCTKRIYVVQSSVYMFICSIDEFLFCILEKEENRN